MVYHPIVIANCWAWNGGKDAANVARGNGNGFKQGGGGTSGGAAFAQSVGAHLITNCVSFNNTNKGYDQNNAYEAMYLFNNVAWGNDYNYRFPTVIPYGTMYLRNNIGFKASMFNHEFLSASKEGSKVPDTGFNSWTSFDGCDPYKDGNKVNGVNVWAKDYSTQFENLSIDQASAPREADGSLPVNEFTKLVATSLFVNSGATIQNFIPLTASPGGISLPAVSIPYNEGLADLGAFETGDVTTATLVLTAGKQNQQVYAGTAIQPTVYKWGEGAEDVEFSTLPEGLTAVKDSTARTLTVSGIPTGDGSYSVSTIGGMDGSLVTINCNITRVLPSKILTGDWYSIQDEYDKLPEDFFNRNSLDSICRRFSGHTALFHER